MSKKLLELYTSLLATANAYPDEEGNVSVDYGGDSKKPLLIAGKRVVLPIPLQLKNPDWANRIAFHPMYENIMDEESKVLEQFRLLLNTRLNFTISTLALDLLILATSTGTHARLNPDQSEFLSHVKDADEKTLELYKKLLSKMPISQTQRQPVVIFLKRGATLDGRKHARGAIVNFPLYNELKKGEEEIYGVKLTRKKDAKTLIRLFEYIFANIDHKDAYSRASDSQQAPALDALMKAVAAVGGALNDTIELFKNQLDEPDKLKIESGWMEAFQNIDTMMAEARTIPMLKASAGEQPAEPAQTSTAAQPAKSHNYPWEQQQRPPQGYGFGQQPPAQQPPAQTQVIKTSRGIDFESLIRATPALQQGLAPSPFGTLTPQQQRDGPPRWAAPGYGGAGWSGTGGGWGGGGGGGFGGGFSGGPRF